ncbi:MAG: DUF1731 domain-containing protein [Bacteroidia bacterium]|nr:DUF1731 domain-containing protein [Bacteroidia bacterium]
MDIAIIGYKTHIGRELKKRLRAKGHIIREIDREHLIKLTPVQMGMWLSGCSVVLDVTTTPFIAKWTGKFQYGLYADRMELIKAIVASLKYCDPVPDMLLNLSNCMVYDKYEVHDDFSSQFDDGFFAEVGQMELSETLKAHKYARSMRISLLRTGYVISEDSPAFKVLRKSSHIGIGGIIDNGYQCLPMIHEEDLMDIIEMLIDVPKAQGIFNVTIPNMASMNELVDAIKKHQGSRQISLPRWLLNIIMGRAVAMLEQNCKVLPQRLVDMGYKFLYPDVESIMDKCFDDIKNKGKKRDKK